MRSSLRGTWLWLFWSRLPVLTMILMLAVGIQFNDGVANRENFGLGAGAVRLQVHTTPEMQEQTEGQEPAGLVNDELTKVLPTLSSPVVLDGVAEKGPVAIYDPRDQLGWRTSQGQPLFSHQDYTEGSPVALRQGSVLARLGRQPLERHLITDDIVAGQFTSLPGGKSPDWVRTLPSAYYFYTGTYLLKPGAEADAAQLREVFQKLGYRVEPDPLEHGWGVWAGYPVARVLLVVLALAMLSAQFCWWSGGVQEARRRRAAAAQDSAGSAAPAPWGRLGYAAGAWLASLLAAIGLTGLGCWAARLGLVVGVGAASILGAVLLLLLDLVLAAWVFRLALNRPAPEVS